MCHMLILGSNTCLIFVIFSVIGAAGDAAVGGVSSLATLGVFKYFAGGMFPYSYLNHLLIY